MNEPQQLQAAKGLIEEVMSAVDPSDPAHKLASAQHLVLEVLLSAPQPASAEQMQAVYAQAAQQAAQRAQEAQARNGLIEAAPPPTEQIRSLASVPPGSYEAPRNEDGTVATGPAAAPSLYEQRRNDDGSIAS